MWFSRERSTCNTQASNNPLWDYPEQKPWDGSWVGIMCNTESQAKHIKEAFHVDLRYTLFFKPVTIDIRGRIFRRIILFRPGCYIAGTDQERYEFDRWKNEVLLPRLTPDGKMFFVD